MYPRHGYSFKDTTVWSSPNDSKCLRLGVSVLKIFNLPIPEVAFKNNVKISLFFATRPCALILLSCKVSTFFYALESAREVDGSCIVTEFHSQNSAVHCAS